MTDRAEVPLRVELATGCAPIVGDVPASGSADAEPASFYRATADHARGVLEAGDGWPTYDAGIAFLSLAIRVAASPDAPGQYPEEEPMALYMIWGALTDAMDAPGRGSPEQDAAAVAHLRRAAAEWLAVVDAPQGRAAYCDRWVHEECGYERKKPTQRAPFWRAWFR